LWPNGWMHQDATSYGGRPQPRGLCVRWGPGPPPQKGGGAFPNFRLMFIAAKRLHGSRCHLVRITEVGFGLSDIVLDGDPAAPPLKGHTSQFLANVRCRQTAP